MIVGRTVWAQSTSLTDRQMDKFTMTKTALCIASRGKNVTVTTLIGLKFKA